MWRKLFGVGKLSPAKFAELVVEVGVGNGVLENPQIDHEQFAIKAKGQLLNLANIYAAFVRMPRRARLPFITSFLVRPELPTTWEDVKPALLPVLRDGAYLTIAQLMVQLQPPDDVNLDPTVARRPLVPGLFRTLVIDSPTSMAVVQERQLAEWGVDFDAAFDVAIGNLRAKSQDAFQQVAPGLWLAPWEDAFAAARLLLPEILQRVCTDPLVCVPNRDVLIVADPTWPDAFPAIVTLLEKIAEDERYGITRTIYQLEHKTLRPFAIPAAPAEAVATYQRLRLAEQLEAYNQEQELRARLDDTAFYASLRAFEREDGTLFTRVAWTEGADPSYLPPADLVTFIKLDGERATGMWEVPWDVVEATPGMLTKTDALLPRWRTSGFPAEAWLDAHGTRVDLAAA